ncbi:MAG: hypothetical protein PHY64_02925 [Eubacteriales bacterium]|nr:hypothetical protein [Eubacteriales bacterium]
MAWAIILPIFFGSLSDNQIAVLEEIGTTDMPAAEADGTTITPLAAIGDEDFYYLMLRIEAPEGTVLDMQDGYYQINNPDSETALLSFDNNSYPNCGYEVFLSWQDDDPSDNVITLVIRINAQYGCDLKFNDGVSKFLCIDGLWLQSPDKTYTRVLDGTWTFDIGLYGASESKTLDVEGKSVIGDGGYEMTLTSMDVSPLSIRCSYTYDSLEGVTPGPGNFYAVMKDGTQIEVNVADGQCTNTSNSEHGYFSSPVELSEMASIQFGDLVIPVE